MSYYKVIKQENPMDGDSRLPLTFSAEINSESFGRLVSMLNSVPHGYVPYIYFSGRGGESLLISAFVDLFNLYKPVLIAHHSVCSSSLDIFLNSNTERHVLDMTEGLHHMGSRVYDVETGKNGEPDLNKSLIAFDKNMAKCELFTNTERFLKLNKKEKRFLNKKGDLYIGAERLRKAVARSEKYFKNLQKTN